MLELDNKKSQYIKSEGVSILSSMDSVSPISLDTYLQNNTPSKNSINIESNALEILEMCQKSGYVIHNFVERFIITDAGQIPVVKTKLDFRDRLETLAARSGITRNNYKITPGLYGVGNPDENSEVLVTANFKLTFDILRTSLNKRLESNFKQLNADSHNHNQINAWILVLDTRGVNVWCAAGKGTFSTYELVNKIKSSGIEKLVKHRRVILPQLSASGIRAKDVKKMSGFSVIYGPIKAQDIPLFLENGRKALPEMRQISFNFIDRLILTPIELSISFKYILLTTLILFIISGFGDSFFSFKDAYKRGLASFIFLLTALFSGAVVTPALLPFLPFKEFAAKGIVTGSIFSFYLLFTSPAASMNFSAKAALFIFGTAVSSWFAMNFTGATPFTSPSGVEKEMKKFIPIQAGLITLSLVLWIYSAF